MDLNTASCNALFTHIARLPFEHNDSVGISKYIGLREIPTIVGKFDDQQSHIITSTTFSTGVSSLIDIDYTSTGIRA